MRTVGIWVCGLLACACFGGLVGDALDRYGFGGFFGAVGGALAFSCARLWFVSSSKGQ